MVSLVGNIPFRLLHIIAGKSKFSLGEDNWKFMPGLSWTLPYVPLLFADFNLYYFTVINCNYNSFSEFCEFFPLKPRIALGAQNGNGGEALPR